MSTVDNPNVEGPDVEGSAVPRPRPKRGVPEGLWMLCDGCEQTVYRKKVEALWGLCPECGHHFYISARTRIRHLLDADTFEEWFANMAPQDPLGFVDKRPYIDRLADEQAAHGTAWTRALPDEAISAVGRWCLRRPIRPSSWGAWARSLARN